MKNYRFALPVAGLIAGLLLATAPVAHAACLGIFSQPVFHTSSRFENCSEPADTFVWLLANPSGVNSNGQDGVCEEGTGTNGIGQACQPQAGTASDGIITVLYDFGSFNTGSLGCPNPTGAGLGTAPIGVQTIAADGSSVLATMSYSVAFTGYVLESVHQTDGSGQPLPLLCDFGNSPAVNSISEPFPGLWSLDLNIPMPALHSDCDPGSGGVGAIGTCVAGNTAPPGSRGSVYTRGNPCGTTPDTRRSQWSFLGNPDPATGAFSSFLPQSPNHCSNDPGITGCLDLAAGTCDTGGTDTCVGGALAGSACATDPDCDPFIPLRDCGDASATCVEVCDFVGVTANVGSNPGTCVTGASGTCQIGTRVCIPGPNICNTAPFEPCVTTADCNPPATCDNPAGLPCTSDADCVLPDACAHDSSILCTSDADCDQPVVGEGIAGSFQVGGPTAASDRAVARLAELGKNVLKVEFTVSLEQNARDFDILAGGRVLNDSPIPAENRGTYVASIEKAGGKLKGEKSIVIRTNLAGGGELMSAPLTIKKGNK